MTNWYVKRGNEIAGPLTQERVKELAAQGKIQATDLVRKGEDGSFIEASQIPGLLPEEDDFESVSSSSQTAPKKNNTILIVVLVVLGGGGVLFVMLLMALLLPAVQQAREAARRSQSKNNLKQIGLALHNYHDAHRVFPPGGTTKTDGTPYHSWQTFILPFMDQAPLYNRIDFRETWTAQQNQGLFKQEIPQYLNPTIEETTTPEGFGLSHYVANKKVMGTNSWLRFRDITDGTSNTIVAFEAADHFKAWGDPTNFGDPVDYIGSGHKTPYRGGGHVLLGDGSVRFVSENIDPALLEALSTPDGGERVGEF
ncbi:hypothetical protein Enr10x_34660 [Gimesia panareensis]|uniref:Uncharacterized protein n=1 Tax=Gimesia panareensis TaxID=2527978 RepID=A0A517Q930_9PLAN|nr:DUF1559 domain-containing protein [Gimesia panareensis]QDT28127.1 hypothetical protein Enr10x_34660 [Gimesia panareensis]